jgi:hypothetical protein
MTTLYAKAFDKGCSHLMKQNAKSQNANHFCLYRGPKGRKCPVGAFIADKHYRKCLENCGVEHKGVKNSLAKSGWKIRRGSKLAQVMNRLQSIHDFIEVKRWKSSLIEAAEDFSIPIPNCLLSKSKNSR